MNPVDDQTNHTPRFPWKRKPGLTFFNLDLHVSVIEDVKTVFQVLFPNVQIVDWSISGHSHLFSHTFSHGNRVLSTQNWRMFDMLTVQHFHSEYHEMMESFDGFIVTHTPIFAMLYERYHKPVILVNSCRYHQPLCWTNHSTMRKLFHECLERLSAKGLLTIVHNNIADMRFFQRQAPLVSCPQFYIPSLCRYVRTSYNPKSPSILVDDRRSVLSSLRNWCGGLGVSQTCPYVLKPKPSPFEWHELCEHQAVLLIPTEVSFMTFFEYLQATIPMFIPSRSLMESWIRTGRLRMGTLADYEMHDEDLLRDWLPYADYYYDVEIQHAMIYFDSIDDLRQILSHPSLDDILHQKHRILAECRRRRTNAILQAWTDVFHIDYFQFVCYNFWPCLADFHLDVDYSNEPLCSPFYHYNPIQPNHIQPNQLIFVKTDLVPMFMQHVRPLIQTPFRLLVGVSDMTPANLHMETFLKDDLCTKIYATNCLHEHPKIEHLPIGFAEPLRDNGDGVFLRSRFISEWRSQKSIDLFIRTFRSTNDSRISKISELSQVYGNRRFDTIVRLTEVVGWKDLHIYLGRSKFALCLRGNGIDTHYFYECILNECVPLVWQDPVTPRFPLYASFPCIQFVDPKELEGVDWRRFYETIDWNDAKQKLLRRYYRDLKSC